MSFRYYAEPAEIKSFLEDSGYEVELRYSPEGKEIGFAVRGTGIQIGYGYIRNGTRYATITTSHFYDIFTHTLLELERAKQSEELYQELKRRFGDSEEVEEMPSELYTWGATGGVAVEQPTPEELEHHLTQLDSIHHIIVDVKITFGMLIIDSLYHGQQGRLRVTYSGAPSPWRLDKTLGDEEYLEFVFGVREREQWSLGEAVPRSVALEIARYFLQHNALPERPDWRRSPREPEPPAFYAYPAPSSVPPVKISQPTPNDVIEYLLNLDGTRWSSVHLSVTVGRLMLDPAREGRMVVYFLDDINYLYRGHLRDKRQPMDRKRPSASYNRDADRPALGETVPKEQALDVALHFLAFHTLPKGLTWVGEMSGFE